MCGAGVCGEGKEGEEKGVQCSTTERVKREERKKRKKEAETATDNGFMQGDRLRRGAKIENSR